MEKGCVLLVGAGPGDCGLLTLRGKQALESADVVLCDRLVSEEIRALIPPGVALIDVGKRSGDHSIPQEEINAMLLHHARVGRRVVRLKGGDPFLFGRGAEELSALAAEGIAFEVVPGVSSAIAVPAYGGIPVTHRDLASSVHIVAAHPRKGAELDIRYEQLVQLDGTLVFLMGASRLAQLTEGLIAAGMAPETPAALIENGTGPRQRRLRVSVGEMADRAAEENFCAPSVLVVGAVCALAESLDWFTPIQSARFPLAGLRVLAAGPQRSAGELAKRLRALGSSASSYPCIRTEPLPLTEEFFDELRRAGWLVFTSPFGAELFFRRLDEAELDIRILAGIKLAALGPKTATALTRRGLRPALLPETYSGQALAEALREAGAPGERLLLFRSASGAQVLAATLRAGGFLVGDLPAYRTLLHDPDAASAKAAVLRGEIDCVTFTSASAVDGFLRSLPELDAASVTAVCIGEETARAARARGMRVRVAEKATQDSMVDCILQYRKSRGGFA